MIGGFRAIVAAATLVLGALITTPAAAGVLQCAPFARQVSGIALYGNANSWWGQAEGRYERGHEPRVGAVLAFAASRSMPVGHVAMVSKVINEREVLLTHANWSYRGGIERNVRAIDVSPNNDWTNVRVWYGPMGIWVCGRTPPRASFTRKSRPLLRCRSPWRIAQPSASTVPRLLSDILTIS